MSEIKEGEYIRTYEGTTYKVNSVAEGLDGNVFIKDSLIYTDEIAILRGEIKAHSKNIIDLIEVGDIVNGCEVMNIHKPRDIWEPIEVEINSKCTRCFLEGEIKTILTHELYEQNSYKVEE